MAISKPLLVFFSLVFYNLSFSWAALDPTYQSLLQCLSEIIPSLNVSAVIVSNNNPSFASILESPIYNARFNRTATPKPAIIITPSDESHVSVAAIRGAGGANFGVVTAYKIKLVKVPLKATVFKVERFLDDNGTEVAFKRQTVGATTDPNLFTRMLLQPNTKAKQTM
ncbi:hypothetical protein PVK06_034200 [Gossypium arboreum]|uniref:Uncharacterized protein n=1 Tax=Gossypium arboreum TaxID=29729 RepID=A0ABR0NE38_GOSAR|nr:hypothetical protein PVK06_034200 [Gossypium arboreum]